MVVIATPVVTATKVGTWTRIGHALLRFQTGNCLGLELLAAVGFNVKNLAAITELGKRHG